MKKKIITATIAVHPTQAELIQGLQSGKINLQNDSLRTIGKKCEGNPSPQQIVHHMKQLLKLGIVQFIHGEYTYIKSIKK